MKYILATKQGMTQVFDESGAVQPATVLSAGPMTVTQVKTTDSDGYEAVQVAYGEQKAKRLKKAQAGIAKKAGVDAFHTLAEFRVSTEGVETGNTIDVSAFAVGDTVTVSATSKAKGFQGVVKRHNFAGGPRSHGQKHEERAPGSIGIGGVQRVFKGTRMAGRMGGTRVTVKNLKIVQIDTDTNTLVVSGAVPGRKGTLVEVVTA